MEHVNDIEHTDTQNLVENDPLTETVRIVVEKHPYRLECPSELSEPQHSTSYATIHILKQKLKGFLLPRLKKSNTSLMNKKNLT